MFTKTFPVSVADEAQAMFEREIKARVADCNPHDFLAIDVDSGDYEIADNDMTPGDRLRERHPDARVFLRRVGDIAVYSVGNGYRS